MGLFSPLKGAYGRLVQEIAGLGVNHIDKPDFLRLFYQARHTTFTSKNIKSAFQTVGIVPFDPQKVLSRLKVRTPSPPPPPLQNSDNQPIMKTPYNTTDLQAHIKVIQQHHIQGSRPSSEPGLNLGPEPGPDPVLDPGLTQAIHYIVKGCNLAYHENTFLKEEINQLRAENQIRSKKKQSRRSYVARGGLLQVEDGRELARAKANPPANPATQRQCGNCRLPGHNRRKCPGIQDSIHVVIS